MVIPETCVKQNFRTAYDNFGPRHGQDMYVLISSI